MATGRASRTERRMAPTGAPAQSRRGPRWRRGEGGRTRGWGTRRKLCAAARGPYARGQATGSGRTEWQASKLATRTSPFAVFASSAVKSSSRKEAHGVAEEEECWGGRRAVGVCPHPLCLPLPPSHPPSSLHPGWQRPSALAGDHVFRVCLPWLSVRSPPLCLSTLLAASLARSLLCPHS